MDYRTKAALTQRAYPVVILQDRYGGAYSGGEWLAIAQFLDRADESMTRFGYVVDIAHGGDCTAAAFECPEWVGVGKTPDEALNDLYAKTERAMDPTDRDNYV